MNTLHRALDLATPTGDNTSIAPTNLAIGGVLSDLHRYPGPTIPALEDRVTRTLVRSPLRGIVKTMVVKTVGGVVQPGNPVAEVVPLEETLLVEARLRPSELR